MTDISAELNRLSELDELSGPEVAAVLDAEGWTGERRNPAKEWATAWRRGDARVWIQGDGPAVQGEFTVWHRDVDDERPDPDTYFDDLYDAASARLPGLVAQLKSGHLGARLESSDEDLTNGADYIEHSAWRVADKVVLAGAKHDDTDVPVQLVVVVRDYAADAEDDGGEWP
ncbi:hypothetical protein ABVB69_07855 [Streptomyces sp. NPDC000349]|uniref:hypothetical protein n=1 Tax=unclassified Streptomyces TaxID=2593676 RepID=UPI002780DF50|nr:hypothetical protein [Streptomyces sp. DSM 40167]MDQ0405769.1 hypothetical protein [Streptomyces sp. DSM 40167]